MSVSIPKLLSFLKLSLLVCNSFESVAAERSVLPSMHPLPDWDETVQSGGGSEAMIQSPSLAIQSLL